MSVENRVAGIETEYGLLYALSEEQLQERERRNLPPQVWGDDPGPALKKVFDNYLPANLPRGGGGYDQFLGNGMRLYVDVGSHPEAAGAETTEIQEIVDGDLAADKLLFRALRKAHLDGAIRNFVLLRRVIDAQGTTWGRHENYRVDRQAVKLQDSELVSHAKMRPMVPFLAVRSMIGGAGCLDVRNRFSMGQKITTAVIDIGLDTTQQKPLYNTRDEPHGDGYRHHVVLADPTSPHVTARNMEATSLVLRMIEHGRAPKLYDPYPNWAFFGRRAALDLSLSYAADVGGRSMTGLNVHELYLEHADAMPDELLSPAELRGREKWHAIYERLQKVQTAVKEATPEDRTMAIQEAVGLHLRGHVDWADRLDYIAENRQRNGGSHSWKACHDEKGTTFVDYSDASAAADANYDVIGRGTGMNRTYLERLKAPEAAPFVDQQRIDRRMFYPPAAGRAALRGHFLHEFADDPNTAAHWNLVGYEFPDHDKLQHEYHFLRDPTVSEDADLNEFIARAKRAQPESLKLYEERRKKHDRSGQDSGV